MRQAFEATTGNQVRLKARAKGAGMAFVEINPRYQVQLRELGLTRAEHFLELSGVIASGHPDRYAARVTLSDGCRAMAVFLKRQHRNCWGDRLANALAGFGFVSRSYREAILLGELRKAGVGCPEFIAAGEDRRGRSFLLVRELTGAVELRVFLCDRTTAPGARRVFARRLGQALARLHDAGFSHADLYSKHVLVGAGGEEIHFLDWQRSRRWQRVSWARRLHDLAALDASLADDLVSERERRACLRAYLTHALQGQGDGRPQVTSRMARRVRRQTRRLLQLRRVRELRQVPLPAGTQSLLWLNGEALCMTRQFHAELRGRLPEWLEPGSRPPAGARRIVESKVSISRARQATLIRRTARRPLYWLSGWLRKQPRMAPEIRQAGTLFNLQRCQVPTPRVLAFGQRFARPWRTESFLVTEAPPRTVGLVTCLEYGGRRERWQVLRETGALLARVHAAHYPLAGRRGEQGSGWDRPCPLLVQWQPGKAPLVILGRIRPMRRRQRLNPARVRRDLAALWTMLRPARLSRTDRLRLVLGYLNGARLTPAAKRLLRPAWAQWLACLRWLGKKRASHALTCHVVGAIQSSENLATE